MKKSNSIVYTIPAISIIVSAVILNVVNGLDLSILFGSPTLVVWILFATGLSYLLIQKTSFPTIISILAGIGIAGILNIAAIITVLLSSVENSVIIILAGIIAIGLLKLKK